MHGKRVSKILTPLPVKLLESIVYIWCLFLTSRSFPNPLHYDLPPPFIIFIHSHSFVCHPHAGRLSCVPRTPPGLWCGVALRAQHACPKCLHCLSSVCKCMLSPHFSTQLTYLSWFVAQLSLLGIIFAGHFLPPSGRTGSSPVCVLIAVRRPQVQSLSESHCGFVLTCLLSASSIRLSFSSIRLIPLALTQQWVQRRRPARVGWINGCIYGFPGGNLKGKTTVLLGTQCSGDRSSEEPKAPSPSYTPTHLLPNLC